MAHNSSTKLPLSGLGTVTAYRYSNYDTPFWARQNSIEGRWHVPNDGATQYLSLAPEGAWADLIRHENLVSEDEAAQVRMTLWEARADLGSVVDYSTFAGAADAGFSPEALVDDDYAACQEEGRRLRELGYAGVLAPSAALPGAVSLTLFGPRRAIAWNETPILASAIPARPLGVGGPPPELVDRVRKFGEVHSGLQAFVSST